MAKSKKIKLSLSSFLLGGVLLMSCGLLVTPEMVSAAWGPGGVSGPNTGNTATDISAALTEPLYFIIAKAAFGASAIITLFMGFTVAILSWVLTVILNINTQIVDSPVVTAGYPIVLGLANLLLSIGIIVIGYATMFRIESYGAKKALPALIAVAILINFGLLIAGTILGIADGLASYFLNNISPTGGGTGGQGQQFLKFITAMSGAFNPQSFFVFDDSGTTQADLSKISGVFAQIGSDVGELLVPIAAVIFTIIAMLAIIITLGVLIVMLLVRYVKLSFYLVLLPLAWATIPFPGLKQYNRTWWSGFIKQAMFIVAVLFFLFLGIEAAAAMAAGGRLDFAVYASNSNEVWASVSNLLTNFFSPLIQQFMNVAVLSFIFLGGIFAAQHMSIQFSGAAMNAVQGIGKTAMGVVDRQRRKVQAGAYGGLANLDKVGAGRGRFLRTLSAPIRGIGRGISGTGVGRLLEREGTRLRASDVSKNLEEYSKLYGGLSTEQAKAQLPKVGDQAAAAILRKAQKEGWASEIDNEDFTRAKKVFEAANLMPEYDEEAKKSGLALVDLLGKQAGAKDGTYTEDGKTQQELLRQIDSDITKALKKMSPDAIAKVFQEYDADKKYFGMDEAQYREAQKVVATRMATTFTGGRVGNVLSEFTGNEQYDNLRKSFERVAKDAADRGEAPPQISAGVTQYFETSPGAKSLGATLERAFGDAAAKDARARNAPPPKKRQAGFGP